MWTRDDLNWLKASYPSLREVSPGIIEGDLAFSMLRVSGQYTVSPPNNLVENTQPPDYLHISDTYSIRITWLEGAQYPRAHENGGKLADTASRLNKSLMDMHQYDHDGALCLAADMALDKAFRSGFQLDVFIEGLLIPYLFAQSHFAKTGIWLWGELSHGFIGIFEWLTREEEPTPEDISATRKSLNKHLGTEHVSKLREMRWRPHFKCLCGSGAKTRDCHPEIIKALSLLRSVGD